VRDLSPFTAPGPRESRAVSVARRPFIQLGATFDGSVVRLFKDGRELAAEPAGLADAAAVMKIGPPAPPRGPFPLASPRWPR
jgi:hypothetical protein